MSTGDRALIREARRVADTPSRNYHWWENDAVRLLRQLADALEAALAVVPAPVSACMASQELIRGLSAILGKSGVPGTSTERFGILAATKATVDALEGQSVLIADLRRKVDIAVKAYEMLRALDTDIRDEDGSLAGDVQ